MLTNTTEPGDYDMVRQDIKLILPNIDWDDSCFLGPVFLRLVSCHIASVLSATTKLICH